MRFLTKRPQSPKTQSCHKELHNGSEEWCKILLKNLTAMELKHNCGKTCYFPQNGQSGKYIIMIKTTEYSNKKMKFLNVRNRKVKKIIVTNLVVTKIESN